MLVRNAKLRLAGAACAIFLSACGGGGGGASSPPPPPTQISVTISPSAPSVILGATQQFTAAVSGTSNTAVTWAVNGTPGGNAQTGTISASGLYTAPQNLPTPASVSIMATAQADSSRSATTTATIQSDLVVTISPDPASVELGASRQFAAAVASAGNPNRNVTWAVNGVAGGNAALGTISSSGLFTAPQNLPSPAQLMLTATSAADSTKTDTAALAITSNFTLALNGPGSMNTGAVAGFTATLVPVAGSAPNPALVWSVSGVVNGNAAVGQICEVGLAACAAPSALSSAVEYRAPLVAPTGGLATVTVTSAADAAKNASVVVTINTVVTVVVTPQSPVSVLLDTPQIFSATVTGTTDQRVIWDVNGAVGGNQATTGAISNPASGTGPATYFAPSQLPGGSNQVTVRATSQFDPSKSASVTVQLTSNVFIAATTISGANSSVRAVGRTETLCVAIVNAVNSAVMWSINGTPNGNATVGTLAPGNNPGCPAIGPSGALVSNVLYTAPAVAPVPDTVTATVASVADPSRTASVAIQIVPAPTLTITPANALLSPSAVLLLTPNVVGTPVLGVAWTVNGVANGDATNGFLCAPASNPCQTPAGSNAAVEYRAPSAIPANPIITVTAVGADGGNGTATITLTTQPIITKLLPASITTGVASDFTLKVVGTNFVAGSGAGASTILFGTPPAAKVTSCIAPASGPHECTATVAVAEVAAAGSTSVQIQNPNSTTSNAVSLIVDPDVASEDVITLTGAAPVASGKNISVVEPIGAGAGTQSLNLRLIGIVTNNTCSAQASPIVIQRPASGTLNVDICLGDTGLQPSQQFTLSGPSDVTLGTPTALSAGFVQVRLPLTIPAGAQTGARTLFVQNANKEKTAATGAIDIR